MPTLLLLKAGSTLPAVRRHHADFEDWFLAALPATLTTRVLDLPAGDDLPDATSCQFDGVLITGSPAMVTAREPWSEACAAWLVDVVETGLPILGVCYGHQLLAHAVGGRVGSVPSGREIGCHEIRLADASQRDPLLAALPVRFPAQLTHQESVLELPPQALWLGASELDPNQIFRLGQCAWGVQFHPEFSSAVMRGYLQERAATLQAEGLDVDALLAGVQETPEAASLIARFGQIVLNSSSR